MFEIVCYGRGKLIIPIVTFDRARSQGRGNYLFPWHGVAKGSDGRFVLSPGAYSVLRYSGTTLVADRVGGGVLVIAGTGPALVSDLPDSLNFC